MQLMVCIDGSEHATLPMVDADDVFNGAAERGALDRAYEAKESNPDSVVTIVIVGDPPEGPRSYMEARFDVTDLTTEQRSRLAMMVGVQHEGGTDEGYPNVPYPEIEWIDCDDEGPGIDYGDITDGAKAFQQGFGERVGGPGDPRNDRVGAILHPDLAENFGDDPFATVSYVVQRLVAAALAPEHRDIVYGRQVVQLRQMGQWARGEGGRPV